MRRLLFAFLFACSNPASPADAGGDASDGAAIDANFPPSTFVFRKMFAGDTDRAFKANATAWRSYGEDLDGLATTSTSMDTCRLTQGAPASVQTDGDAGIDNSFGQNVLPILMQNGFAIPSLQWSESIQQGATRPVLARLDGATASIRAGALLPTPPDFTSGTGAWLVSSLAQAQAELALTNSNGMLRASSPQTVIVYVPFDKGVLQLRVHRFTFHAGASLDGRTLDGGSIAGILDTNELLETVRQAMGATRPSVCTAFDAIAASIRQTQDILIDGSQNPGTDCNAISFGVGFEGAAIGFGAMVSDPGPATPCP